MDTVTENVTKSNFPQPRMDAMRAFARKFLPEAHAARADDASSIYVRAQLEQLRQGLYEIRYPELKGKKIIPFTNEVAPGAEQFTVRSIDVAGEPRIMNGDPSDVPEIALKVGSATMSMFNLELAYSYTDQEIETAMYAGMPLSAWKAKGVRDQMARRLDTIAFLGETSVGVLGLLNQTGTTTYTPAATGAAGALTWDSKDSDAILLDLNQAGDAIITGTLEVESPDTWLLPLTSHRLIANKRVGDGTSSTVLAYFLLNRDPGNVPTVVSTTKAETAGGSSTKRLTVYRNDPSKLQMHVPLEFRQLAPERRGFKTITNCWMRTGGVALYLPKSVSYADGI